MIKISVVTLLISLAAGVGVYRSVVLVRKDKLGVRAAVIWLALWAALAVLALFPGAVTFAMELAQMRDRLFFITMCGVLVALALIYQQTTETDRLRRQIARLAQEQALENWRTGYARETGAGKGPNGGSEPAAN